MQKYHFCGILFFMDVREAHQLVSQLESIDSGQNPELITWAEQQPDILLARQTLGELAIVSNQLVQLAELRASQTTAESESNISPEVGVNPSEIDERPRAPTPGELLWARIDKKYERLYAQYKESLDAARSLKKSKKDYRGKMAARNFARQFNDFSDLTGDANAILQAELLGAVVQETVFDDDLREAIFSNAAEFAQKSVADVTKDPKNFAYIIAASVKGSPFANQFENVVKGIFSSGPAEMPELNARLAAATFELLEDLEALRLITEIVYLRKPYVPVAFHSERMKIDAINAGSYDYSSLLETNQINSVFKAINEDITGLHYSLDQRPGAAQRIHEAVNSVIGANEAGDENLVSIPPNGTEYDPVEAVSVTGERIDLGVKIAPDEIRNTLEGSGLFAKRMQELAPYSYSIRTAKKIMGEAVHGLVFPLSPSLTLDIFELMTSEKPTDVQKAQVRNRISQMTSEIAGLADSAKEHGVQAFEPGGKLGMIYIPLFEDANRLGLAVLRPSVPLDKVRHGRLRQMQLNYTKIVDKVEHTESDELAKLNDELRQAIKAGQQRFLGRREIKFSLPDEYKKTGLSSVSLRYNPKSGNIVTNFNLNDGAVEVDMDRDFNIDPVDDPYRLSRENLKLYYENLVLRLVKHWACYREVRTSEGIISETSGNNANMGHYAYLRVREDGRRYNFSEAQRLVCLEEQGKDLQEESLRRQVLDETGMMRNSTYVREFYDPAQPPLVVYGSNLLQSQGV